MHSESQANLGYTTKLCFKKNNQRNKQQIVASVLTVVSVLDLFGIMGCGEVSCYEEQP